MRSAHADYFNHDPDAPVYDQDVRNEGNPVRAGYARTLAWVAAQIPAGARVLDLGSGTGNTLLALPASCPAVAVDISAAMTHIARRKLAGRPVTFVCQDLLEYVLSAPLENVDAVVSTYALHHLIPDERKLLLERLRTSGPPGLTVVIGDLMVADENDRQHIFATHRESYPGLEADLADEFVWNVAASDEMLRALNWLPQWQRFSDLSWGVLLRR